MAFSLIWLSLAVIPFWLVARAWRRYSALHATPPADLLRVRVALALLSVSLMMWLVVYALMGIDERSHVPQAVMDLAVSLRPKTSPGLLFLINIPLDLCSLVLSWLRRKEAPGTIQLKNAAAIASSALIVVWLLFAANPH